MADRKSDARFAASVEHARRIGAAQRKRLFAKHLLSRGGAGDHLGGMQRMWRRQQHCIDSWVRQHGIQIVGQIETAFGAKSSRAIDVRLDRAHDFQSLVAARCIHEIAAPAAQADDSCVDHLITCTDVATMPPVAFSFSHLEASISKPIQGTPASISRSDNAVPIKPSPMIPIGAFGCMTGSPLRYRDYFASMPAALASAVHHVISLRIKPPNSAGGIGETIMPTLASFSRVAGTDRIFWLSA